ncbi:hypothetical protein C0995_002054 [Termitomyces sp. Mi166|nr:hypothetical protein C0995_002054 [Termitomyces sp. Mi166\
MVTKISLLKISASASLLEREYATQDFIIATNTVFVKAQGLAMLVPLYKTVFGLLEDLLDDWCLLNLDSVEWKCKAEVHQACVNLWSLNEQVSWCAELGKIVMSWEHLISTIKQIRLMHSQKMVIELELTAPVVAPKTIIKGKGKAKATEEDDEEEGEATQKLRKKLEIFLVLTKIFGEFTAAADGYYEEDIGLPQGAKILGGRKGCLWNGVGVRMQKKCPPLEALIIAKHVKLVQMAKAFLKQQGKLLQSFVLEGFKGKGKAKALLIHSEQMGAKRAFKSTEVVDSDSDKEEEERAHVIKKIKHEHVEELIGTSKGKEIIEFEDETVAPKTPMAGPSHQTLKPVVFISSAPRSVSKLIIASATPVAGPSTAQIVPSSAPKPTATAPVKSADKLAIKGGSVFKDPFMVRQFKLVGTEESSALIINQVTKVAAGKLTSAATQETLHSEEDSGNKNNNDDSNNNDDNDNEGGKDNDDDSNNDKNAAIDIDSGNLDAKILKPLHPGETQPMAPTKVMVTDDVAPAPVANETK